MPQVRAVLLAGVLALTAACSTAPSAPMFPAPTSTSATAEPSTAAATEPADATTDGPDAPPRPRGALAAFSAGAPALVGETCPTDWGSQPKTDPPMGTGEVDGIRVGRHECFDRVVIDIDGPPAGFNAAYVDTVTADGSGNQVTVPGGAKIQFVVRHPKLSGPAVGGSVANAAGFTTLRSVVAAGSFEGLTTFGVGVRARLPFRVFTVQGGHGRIVLDIAHRWT